MSWARNSRNTITEAHLRRGCPVCLNEIERDHMEALDSEALWSAMKFAEYGYGALFLTPQELEMVDAAEIDPDATLPSEWSGGARIAPMVVPTEDAEDAMPKGFAIVE